MTHAVFFSPQARADLEELYLYIAESDGDDRALAYLERIEEYCRGFATFPERGRSREDLHPGLRIIGFERRLTMAFVVAEDRVTFLRVLYAGRRLELDPT